MALEQLRHHPDTDAEAQMLEFLGDFGAGQIGPEDALLVRVSCGAWVKDFQEGGGESGKEGQAAFAATPFFRAWSGGKEVSARVISARPRSMVLRQQPRMSEM